MRLRGLGAERFSSFRRWLQPFSGNGHQEAGIEASFIAGFNHPEVGEIAAYGKFYPGINKTSRGLVNEITGHVVAQHFGLQVPEPAFLAEIPIKKLPMRELPAQHAWLKKLAKSTAIYPAWCTIEVNAPTPWHHFGPAGSQAIVDDLNKWPQLPSAIVFDHIIANVDRNLRNLLRTGKSTYCLIDHGQLVTSGHWTSDQLKPEGSFRNRLSEFTVPAKPAEALANSMVFAAEEFNLTGPGTAGAQPWWSKLMSPGDALAFDKFLATRTNYATEYFKTHYTLC